MSVDLIRGLYDYHRWANRRLFDVALARGEDLVAQDVGKQFSYTTIRRMFGHLYGADRIWLTRWTGGSPTAVPGGEFATLASIRAPWDDLERDQRAYIERLSASGSRAGHPVQQRGGEAGQGTARTAAPARGEPRHAPPERDRDHADDGQQLAPGHRPRDLPSRHNEPTALSVRDRRGRRRLRGAPGYAGASPSAGGLGGPSQAPHLSNSL